MGTISSKFEIPGNMQEIIDNCAAGLGLTGVVGGLIGPGADLIVIAPTWVGMTVALAEQAGHNMSNQTAKKITMAVATGAGLFVGGTKAAASGIAWLTAPLTLGLSLLVSVGANSALNYSFTKAYGRAAARLFLQTTNISNTEMVVKVIITLIGIDLGFDTGNRQLIS